ncbi:MAG: hypothetical protein KI792_06505 [Alphaproteobacteria bacterium]|nr:hypothetical protein [Alphaproteobacteria bacterium SS10]
MSSINTSPPLFTLLQQINGTNDRFQANRNQISTGNRFGPEAASNFSVAQGIRSDLRGFDAVNGAIGSANGPATTALAASNFTSNLLSQATTSAILALNPANSSTQREILANGFEDQLNQINQISESAVFNGANLAADDPAGGLNVVSGINGEQLNIDSEDFSTTGLNEELVAGGGVGLDALDLNDPTTQLSDVTTAIDDAEQNLALETGRIASGLNAAERQAEFNTEISDAITIGLGALQDTDLARADARDEQLQTQRQLQFLVLNQQNQQRGAVLNLFA